MKEINIYFGTKENAILSNLALRPFSDKNGRVYKSVEHAYQTWKSGKFDEVTFNKRWNNGTKHIGKLPVNKDISIDLMTRLIKASFKENPKAFEALLATRGKKLTHKQDKTIWRKVFPKILMKIRDN